MGSTKPESLKPLALVLVPTRELAVQVCEACHRYGKGLGIAVAPTYGGQEFHRQVVALRRGVHVVVATPGRALDHMRRGTLDFSGLRIVALDEADEMLDMGFAEDLELILEGTPEARQTALFSATLPPRIASIAEKHLRDPERILIARDAATKGSVPKVRQTAYIVPRPHKIAALGRVLDLESPTLALVFCRTRLEVDELAERLVGRGYRVASLHGGMGLACRPSQANLSLKSGEKGPAVYRGGHPLSSSSRVPCDSSFHRALAWPRSVRLSRLHSFLLLSSMTFPAPPAWASIALSRAALCSMLVLAS